MSHTSQLDAIWNRACNGATSESGQGDRALASLLKAHGLTMNGGVLHAVECLTENEFSDAKAGYRFYGLDSAASIMSQAKSILNSGEDGEDYETVLDDRYYEEIPDDDFLDTMFRNHFRTNPSDYDPA